MNHSLTRRRFVATSLTLPLVARGAEPQFHFPSSPRERLAVATYPFRDSVGKGKSSLEEFAATIPGKFQVHGIEPWSPHFLSNDTDYVGRLHDAFSRAGVRVVDIPVDARVHLCGSAEDREAGLVIYRKWVDAAVILGSPSIRIHLPHAPAGQEITCAIASLKPVVEYGTSKNVVINLENDAPETEPPERIAAVINQMNSPFLRALPDFCNSMLIHDDQTYNNQALKKLFTLAYNISHVKNEESDNGKTYRVDVDPIFAISKAAGYRGFFSMEWEGRGDPYAGTKELLEASFRNLSGAA